MLIIVSTLKLIVEVALMAFVGQWLLGLIAGPTREANLFYRILVTMTRPFVAAARCLTPASLAEPHLRLVAFSVLACAWVGATAAKIAVCVQIGVALCE